MLKLRILILEGELKQAAEVNVRRAARRDDRMKL
jgi:hypothetical protein